MLTYINNDDYEEEKIIREGSMSFVKIVHKKEKYAKKELKNSSFESFKQMFSESEILYSLHHPCIIKIFGFFNGDQEYTPSIILSLESQTLENAIKENKLSEELKNMITVEVVLGMRFIH